MATRSTANNRANENIDIVEAISTMARERDISEEMLMSTVEEACKAAFRRSGKQGPGAPMNLSVVIARKKPIQIIARKVIVEEVEDPNIQISLAEARAVRPDFQLGDIVEIDVTPKDFGRVAAQTAKQVIVQRIREAERGKIYDEYVEKENEILTAIVQRVEPKAVYVELGLTEGVMESSEFMPGEEYRVNDHIKVYVLQVQRSAKGENQRAPQVHVSRIHPGLVKRLFEMEVPEIANGIVQIKSIAREAGSRTKMAVYSNEVMIDPVGACVGPRGSRVEKVISELRNEKIDIIKWSPDPAEFVANALNPAHVVSVFISDAEKICRVVVPDTQLSLAIGKEGQNARLAAKLTGWKIDIKSETQFAEQLQEQGLSVEDVLGGEAPAQEEIDFADEYNQQQDNGYEQ
jgi:transcription termination/antitermination protein NusA